MNDRPPAEICGYRGIEYSVFEKNPGEWEWKYYPTKVEQGTAFGGIVKGGRDDAVAAAQAAIGLRLSYSN
jgi:hypothetical protein